MEWWGSGHQKNKLSLFEHRLISNSWRRPPPPKLSHFRLIIPPKTVTITRRRWGAVRCSQRYMPCHVPRSESFPLPLRLRGVEARVCFRNPSGSSTRNVKSERERISRNSADSVGPEPRVTSTSSVCHTATPPAPRGACKESCGSQEVWRSA